MSSNQTEAAAKERDSSKSDDQNAFAISTNKRSLDETNESEVSENVVHKKQKLGSEEKSVLDKKEEEKPKFVFGRISSFSKGFKFTKPLRTDEKEASKKDDEGVPLKPKNPAPAKSAEPIKAFGSSTSFGQGFGLLKEIAQKEKTNPEKEAKLPKDDTEKKEKSEAKTSTPALVKLDEVHNGEEDEDTVFNANTKLYALTDIAEGWKERGLGPIHLNYSKEAKSHRLIIRQRLTLQILLNLKVVKGLKVFKGFPGSANPMKFVRIVITVDKKVVQYTMKFGSEELAEKLYKLLEELV